MALERVLEPEVMDTQEEAVDYNAMDHSTVNEVFVNDLLAITGEPAPEILRDILDLGTGTALIPVELCNKVQECRVMAVDMAAQMLDLAKYNLEINSLTDRIELAQVDAKQMAFPDGQFDLIISNSIIHHIPDPNRCLSEAVRVTRTGGLLFFRDLMRPESSEEVSRLVQQYAGNENAHQKQMFDDSLRAALSLEEIREMIATLGFEKESVTATSDRHWTWTAHKA